MTTDERQQRILEYLRLEKNCKVSEIIALFDVTPATIRRDLTHLEETGQIVRTHGHVHCVDQPTLSHFQMRKDHFFNENQAIAKVAASMVTPGDTVLFDSGPITYNIANAVKNLSDITIVTNSIPIISLLDPSQRNVMLTGGMFDFENMCTIGPDAETFLDNISASILFLETTGIRGADGMTVISPFHAGIKRKMINCARKRVLVMNNSDLNSAGAILFAPFSVLDTLIIAHPIDDPVLYEQLHRDGVEVIVAIPS